MKTYDYPQWYIDQLEKWTEELDTLYEGVGNTHYRNISEMQQHLLAVINHLIDDRRKALAFIAEHQGD